MTESDLLAKTSLGLVKGRECIKPKKDNAKQVYRFSGIPFAEPPIGDLRFELPEKKTDPWDGVLDGTQLKAIPMQQVEMMSAMDAYFLYTNEFDENFEDINEDCLYLKVYTSTTKSTAKLPVMVWFYGGGFQMGGTTTYDGNVLASLHDVVVVMPNYRVNVFGLLSFKPGETTCNGNMGLMDQICALEWVQDNIEAFGGDPNNVTIFGESAGGGSVCLHMASHQSRHLFHRAISHSAMDLNSMVLDKHNDNAREAFLKILKIDEKDPKKALKRLKEIPAEDIHKAEGQMLMEMKYFSIAIDGTFLKDTPERTLSKEGFNRVPLMIGINSTEGYGLIAPGQEKGFATGISKEDGIQALKENLSQVYPQATEEKVFNEVWKKYESMFPDIDDPMRYSRIIGECSGDCVINTSSVNIAKKHSKATLPTYFYRMTHKSRYSHDKEFQPDEGAVFKSSICECDHGDDLIFTFGDPFSKAKFNISAKFSKEEEGLCEQWMGYLVNFATTGNPNEGNFTPKVEWEEFGKNGNHLDVSCNPKLKNGDFYHDRYKFWTQEVKTMLSKKTSF